jgi:hypothetical protein
VCHAGEAAEIGGARACGRVKYARSNVAEHEFLVSR